MSSRAVAMLTPHADVRNPAAYYDRTLQNWHRDAFPRSFSASDLDLYLYCHRCNDTLLLVESTANPERECHALHRLSVRSGVPAIVVVHRGGVPVSHRFTGETEWIIGEQSLVDLEHELREAHDKELHGG